MFFEPAHHPEASKDLNFSIKVVGNSGWVGRNKGSWLDIVRGAHVDRCGCTAGYTGHRWLEAARSQNFTGLVGGARKHGRACDEPRINRRCLGDPTNRVTNVYEPRQL